MARIIVVTASKCWQDYLQRGYRYRFSGPEGKRKLSVIDFDIGLRNLDLIIMGCGTSCRLRFCKRHSGRCDIESGADQRCKRKY